MNFFTSGFLIVVLFAVGVYSNCGCLKCNPQFHVCHPHGSPVKVIYRNSQHCHCPSSLPYSIQIPKVRPEAPCIRGCYGYEIKNPIQIDVHRNHCPLIHKLGYQVQIPVVHKVQPNYLVGLVARTDRIVLPDRPGHKHCPPVEPPVNCKCYYQRYCINSQTHPQKTQPSNIFPTKEPPVVSDFDLENFEPETTTVQIWPPYGKHLLVFYKPQSFYPTVPDEHEFSLEEEDDLDNFDLALEDDIPNRSYYDLGLQNDFDCEPEKNTKYQMFPQIVPSEHELNLKEEEENHEDDLDNFDLRLKNNIPNKRVDCPTDNSINDLNFGLEEDAQVQTDQTFAFSDNRYYQDQANQLSQNILQKDQAKDQLSQNILQKNQAKYQLSQNIFQKDQAKYQFSQNILQKDQAKYQLSQNILQKTPASSHDIEAMNPPAISSNNSGNKLMQTSSLNALEGNEDQNSIAKNLETKHNSFKIKTRTDVVTIIDPDSKISFWSFVSSLRKPDKKHSVIIEQRSNEINCIHLVRKDEQNRRKRNINYELLNKKLKTTQSSKPLSFLQPKLPILNKLQLKNNLALMNNNARLPWSLKVKPKLTVLPTTTQPKFRAKLRKTNVMGMGRLGSKHFLWPHMERNPLEPPEVQLPEDYQDAKTWWGEKGPWWEDEKSLPWLVEKDNNDAHRFLNRADDEGDQYVTQEPGVKGRLDSFLTRILNRNKRSTPESKTPVEQPKRDPFLEPFNFEHIFHQTPILHLLNAPVRYLNHLHRLKTQIVPVVGTIPRVIRVSKDYLKNFVKQFSKDCLRFGADFIRLKSPYKLIPKRRLPRSPTEDPSDEDDQENVTFTKSDAFQDGRLEFLEEVSQENKKFINEKVPENFKTIAKETSEEHRVVEVPEDVEMVDGVSLNGAFPRKRRQVVRLASANKHVLNADEKCLGQKLQGEVGSMPEKHGFPNTESSRLGGVSGFSQTGSNKKSGLAEDEQHGLPKDKTFNSNGISDFGEIGSSKQVVRVGVAGANKHVQNTDEKHLGQKLLGEVGSMPEQYGFPNTESFALDGASGFSQTGSNKIPGRDDEQHGLPKDKSFKSADTSEFGEIGSSNKHFWESDEKLKKSLQGDSSSQDLLAHSSSQDLASPSSQNLAHSSSQDLEHFSPQDLAHDSSEDMHQNMEPRPKDLRGSYKLSRPGLVHQIRLNGNLVSIPKVHVLYQNLQRYLNIGEMQKLWHRGQKRRDQDLGAHELDENVPVSSWYEDFRYSSSQNRGHSLTQVHLGHSSTQNLGGSSTGDPFGQSSTQNLRHSPTKAHLEHSSTPNFGRFSTEDQLEHYSTSNYGHSSTEDHLGQSSAQNLGHSSAEDHLEDSSTQNFGHFSTEDQLEHYSTSNYGHSFNEDQPGHSSTQNLGHTSTKEHLGHSSIENLERSSTQNHPGHSSTENSRSSSTDDHLGQSSTQNFGQSSIADRFEHFSTQNLKHSSIGNDLGHSLLKNSGSSSREDVTKHHKPDSRNLESILNVGSSGYHHFPTSSAPPQASYNLPERSSSENMEKLSWQDLQELNSISSQEENLDRHQKMKNKPSYSNGLQLDDENFPILPLHFKHPKNLKQSKDSSVGKEAANGNSKPSQHARSKRQADLVKHVQSIFGSLMSDVIGFFFKPTVTKVTVIKSKKLEEDLDDSDEVEKLTDKNMAKEEDQIETPKSKTPKDQNESTTTTVLETSTTEAVDVQAESSKLKNSNKQLRTFNLETVQVEIEQIKSDLSSFQTSTSIETQTIHEEMVQILTNIENSLQTTTTTDHETLKRLTGLQALKSELLTQLASKTPKEQTQLKIKAIKQLKQKILEEIISKLDGSDRFTVANQIKLLIRLQKLHCVVNKLKENLSKEWNQEEVNDLIKVLRELDFSTVYGNKVENLKQQIELLTNLKRVIETNDLTVIKKEAKILWEVRNVEKLRRESISELKLKTSQGVKIRRELKILFDLQKQLEKCEGMQADLIRAKIA